MGKKFFSLNLIPKKKKIKENSLPSINAISRVNADINALAAIENYKINKIYIVLRKFS
jgi:hypothetical protein